MDTQKSARQTVTQGTNPETQKLHEKLKTDTHPHIKAWLDKKLDETATSEGKDARAYLRTLAQSNLTDNNLNNAEENLKQRAEKHNARIRNIDNAETKAIFENVYDQQTQKLNFNYPETKYRELQQNKAEDLLKHFGTKFEKDEQAVQEIEDLIARDENEIQNESAEEPTAKGEETAIADTVFNFETGEFTHTKTGEKIPQAKLTERIEREDYLKLSELAKKHGGYYSKISKSFLFKSAQGRDAFVTQAKGQYNQSESENFIAGRGNKNSSTEQATAVKSNGLQTFTTKENPFLGMGFKNLEIKSSYDGRQILATGIESFNSANYYVKIKFPSKAFVKVSFETEQDAVKFVRYVYSHFDGIEKISATNDSFSIGDSGETFHDKYISENTPKDANKTVYDIADSYRPEVEKVRGSYKSPFNCSVNIHWQLFPPQTGGSYNTWYFKN